MAKKKMTAKAALAHALLNGEIINVRNCLDICGLHSPAREIERQIENPKKYGFGVEVSRLKMTGRNRHGQSVFWYNFRLNPLLPQNQDGIQKMREYIKDHFVSSQPSLPFTQ